LIGAHGSGSCEVFSSAHIPARSGYFESSLKDVFIAAFD